jgi:hypothetical protein
MEQVPIPGDAAAPAAQGRQAAAAPAARPDRPALSVRPTPALLTPPTSWTSQHVRPTAPRRSEGTCAQGPSWTPTAGPPSQQPTATNAPQDPVPAHLPGGGAITGLPPRPPHPPQRRGLAADRPSRRLHHQPGRLPNHRHRPAAVPAGRVAGLWALLCGGAAFVSAVHFGPGGGRGVHPGPDTGSNLLQRPARLSPCEIATCGWADDQTRGCILGVDLLAKHRCRRPGALQLQAGRGRRTGENQRWLATSHSPPPSRGERSGRHEHLIHTHAEARRGLWAPDRLGREPALLHRCLRRKAVYLTDSHIWNNPP